MSVEYTSYRAQREAEIINRLQTAMGKVAEVVHAQAKENASKSPPEHPQIQSGKLTSGIGHTVQMTGSNIVALIGFSSEIPNSDVVSYATYLEFGTSRHPPYPFLFPAVEMKRNEIVEILKGAQYTYGFAPTLPESSRYPSSAEIGTEVM